MATFESVWLIRTTFGDAVRSLRDVEVENEVSITLKSNAALITKGVGPIPRSELSVLSYYAHDLPNYERVDTEISNVCGFVAGESFSKGDMVLSITCVRLQVIRPCARIIRHGA